MKKKKSYMDRDNIKNNILSEGPIYQFLVGLLTLDKLTKKTPSEEEEELIKNNPKLKKQLADFDKHYEKSVRYSEKIRKNLEKELKKRGMKPTKF